jgi:hypothetical protein
MLDMATIMTALHGAQAQNDWLTVNHFDISSCFSWGLVGDALAAFSQSITRQISNKYHEVVEENQVA